MPSRRSLMGGIAGGGAVVGLALVSTGGAVAAAVPTMTVAPVHPVPGQALKITGKNFTPNNHFFISWDASVQGISVLASSTGGFIAHLQVPATIGLHTLHARRVEDTATLAVVVIAAVPPTTTPVIIVTPLPSPTPVPVTPTPTPIPTTLGRYYVSKNGDNTDGLTWGSAWNELNQIRWATVQPGDTILLDGGPSGMQYTSTLTVGKSGVSGKPITVARSTESGHNGQVAIFGGRATPLPYCGQTNYIYQTSGAMRPIGIDLGTSDWIVIDGMGWRGITIHGHNGCGLRLRGGSANCSVRNLEIYDNGTAALRNGTWQSDEPGVRFDGANHIFSRMLVHDNGQDGFQDNDEGVTNFTLRESWVYNERQHPARPGLGFNYCTHADAIQVWGGGVQSGMLIEDCILGPGLTNSLILGDSGTGSFVHDVTIRHTLFINAESNNIIGGDDDWPCQNWKIENVTSYLTPAAPTGGHCGIELAGTGHVIKDSIFYDGCVYLPNWSGTASGNYSWKTDDSLPGAINADPQFTGPLPTTNTPTFAQQVGADFALKATSPCLGKGARITSVAQLLSLP